MLHGSRASRRVLLTGGTAVGAAILVASGCGSTDDEGAAGAAADEPTAPAVDADSDLVETVGAQLTTALALARATAASVPQLEPLAGRLAALHRAHLRELSRPADTDRTRVGGTPATARARLLRAEERLQQQLVRAALAAGSGALAQVLAAMAAAVAQERAAS